jgi:hypothetical protein
MGFLGDKVALERVSCVKIRYQETDRENFAEE